MRCTFDRLRWRQLGREDSPSAAENLQQTEQDARKGDHIQMFGLGMTYYNGAEDVEKDDLLALIWLTLAAEDENLKTDPGLMQALAELEPIRERCRQSQCRDPNQKNQRRIS